MLIKVMLAIVMFAFVLSCRASDEANAIFTNVETAFNLLVPIIVTIATFFAVLKIAKRVTRG